MSQPTSRPDSAPPPGRWPWRRWTQSLCLALFLVLFFGVAWPYRGDLRQMGTWIPLESFLWLDPLVGLSTALAARTWNGAVLGALIVLAVCALLPRVFCGCLCPLGTLHDLFDWAIGRRWGRLRPLPVGRWRHLRFYLLAGVLIAAAGGVLLSGFVAAIPVLTRGMMFSLGRIQLGLFKNWGLAGPTSPALWCSLALFALIFLLGLLGPRFWCRYVCPSGALISLAGGVGVYRRRVNSACHQCGRCLEVCPFDAITQDLSTRPLDCAFCQTCFRACPTQAIDQFVVDVFQMGAGTSFHMNMNEVLANRANEILGGGLGLYDKVNPNNHVNFGQSTNDAFPTAIRLAILLCLRDLLHAPLASLEASLRKKGVEFDDVLKSARTHLQDAVPIDR